MKIQTTARVEALSIDGRLWELKQSQAIDLEFSAVDTGGGFKDPILDFSFSVENSEDADLGEGRYEISLTLIDPDNEENEVHFSYESVLKARDDTQLELNGRLKEDQLSRELIGFILNRLR